MRCSDGRENTAADGGAGSQMIAKERARQVEIGWSTAHDDRERDGALSAAAACYALAGTAYDEQENERWVWPWHTHEWKPKSRIENLVRAGALIAAEIDKLLREGGGEKADPKALAIVREALTGYAEAEQAIQRVRDRQEAELNVASDPRTELQDKALWELTDFEFESVDLGLVQTYEIVLVRDEAAVLDRGETDASFFFYWLKYEEHEERITPSLTVGDLYKLGEQAATGGFVSKRVPQTSVSERVPIWLDALRRKEDLSGKILNMYERSLQSLSRHSEQHELSVALQKDHLVRLWWQDGIPHLKGLPPGTEIHPRMTVREIFQAMKEATEKSARDKDTLH